MTLNDSGIHIQRGATMIETLVALFLLVIGLMGTLAMQAKGLNSNNRAQFATDANILAEDMATRILGYVRNLNASSSLDTAIYDDYHGIDTTTTTATDPACTSAGCSASNQVQLDEWQWSQSIKSRLPDGVGKVSYNSGAYTITVMWNHNQIEILSHVAYPQLANY